MSGFKSLQLKWLDLQGRTKGRIALVELDRPQFANALSKDMILELTNAIKSVGQNTDCRGLVLSGKGKHFSAGADLNWMQASASLSEDENKQEARELGLLFETLDSLPLPTVAVVRGASFGGAVGLAACCDICIASDGAKFCLSEVRLGLLPAVILPFLNRRMNAGALRRLCLTAEVFSANDAKQFGLVDQVCVPDDLGVLVQAKLNLILAGGRQAQSSVKRLLRELKHLDLPAAVSLGVDAIASARCGDEGQEGLGAFLEKRPADWLVKLDEPLVFS